MIVYLHGFNSAGSYDNPKVKALQKLDEVKLINYNSFATPYDIINEIVMQLDSIKEDFVIVGSSLGAFYAGLVSVKYDCPSVLINPAYYPAENLQPLVNKQLENFATKEVNVLTDMTLGLYSNFRSPWISQYLPLVIIAKDDEFIDPTASAEVYKDCLLNEVEEGGHQMKNLKDYINIIEHYINNCSILDFSNQ